MTITLHTVAKVVLVISILFQIGFLLTEGFNSETQSGFIGANLMLLVAMQHSKAEKEETDTSV